MTVSSVSPSSRPGLVSILSLPILSQAETRADSFHDDERDARPLEGLAQLSRRSAMNVVMPRFEVFHRAARNFGLLCKLGLCPVQEAASCTA